MFFGKTESKRGRVRERERERKRKKKRQGERKRVEEEEAKEEQKLGNERRKAPQVGNSGEGKQAKSGSRQ